MYQIEITLAYSESSIHIQWQPLDDRVWLTAVTSKGDNMECWRTTRQDLLTTLRQVDEKTTELHSKEVRVQFVERNEEGNKLLFLQRSYSREVTPDVTVMVTPTMIRAAFDIMSNIQAVEKWEDENITEVEFEKR